MRMNTRQTEKARLRRLKREFMRSPNAQSRYRAFRDLVGQAHETFHALRRNMAVEGNAPLWATRRRNLRKLNQSDRAAKKAAEARRLRTIAEAQHGRNKHLQV
jgi:hypothetical protein